MSSKNMSVASWLVLFLSLFLTSGAIAGTTTDVGAATTFNRLVFWVHDSNSPPVVWKVETSDDGAGCSEAYSTTEPQCRGASDQTEVSWDYPSCGQEALFPEQTARYVRYSFDDVTLFGGLHGWGVEIEVFEPDPIPVELMKFTIE